ncbi:hypothetical protein [Terrabacter sp. BE26]
MDDLNTNGAMDDEPTTTEYRRDVITETTSTAVSPAVCAMGQTR